MKKILVVADAMPAGGIEKSICNLLYAIDKKQYEIDLLLGKKQGIFLENIPKEVNILPQLYRITLKNILKRLELSIKVRTVTLNIKKEEQLYQYYNQILPKIKMKYDIAIACHYGMNQFFVANKVDASVKIIQNHTNYKDSVNYNWVVPSIDKNIFSKVDYIVTVSESARQALLAYHPEFREKIKVIHNIVNKAQIIEKSKEYIPFEKNEKINLVTVCRIGREKGLDMVVDIGKMMKKEGYDFVWYIVGEGDYEKEIKVDINNAGLHNNVKITGVKSNPYPYMKLCDIYVQLSYTESWGLTVQEALILGNYVVATDILAFREQIEEGVNGTLTGLSAESIMLGIKRALVQIPNASKKKMVDCTQDEINKYYVLFQKETNMREDIMISRSDLSDE